MACPEFVVKSETKAETEIELNYSRWIRPGLHEDFPKTGNIDLIIMKYPKSCCNTVSAICVYFPKSYTYEKVLKFAGRTTFSWMIEEDDEFIDLWIYNPELQAEFD